MRSALLVCAIGLSAAPAFAQTGDFDALRAEIMAERQLMEAQRARLQALEDRLLSAQRGRGLAQSTQVPLPPQPPAAPGSRQAGIERVGEAPTDQRTVAVAALAEQGGIITKAGRLTMEADLEYARADRNRVLFRGVAIPEAVLIGAFDINESRQDVLTAAGVLRFGLTNRLEINGRAPFIRRSDNSAIAPVVNNGMTMNVGTDRTITNGNLGDVDFGVRYQVTDGQRGWPYLIMGVQAVAPTGTDPFAVPRDSLGNPLRAATGAGFWGITPNVTAILPTDPAVLFGTIGYTYNIGRSINRQIGSAIVERVEPGGQPGASVGIALSVNPRVSLSLGYAHTVAIGTKTRLRSIDPRTQEPGDPISIRTRDLQLGRLLFGVSYRVNTATTINWNIELGATDDATDLRTSLRIPFSFNPL